MAKIGMCCACGGGFHRSETILYQGDEYCRDCADMMGLPEDEDLDKRADAFADALMGNVDADVEEEWE